MEPLVSVFVFTAGVGVVHLVGGVLSVLALAASVVVVVATAAERDGRLLASGRGGSAAFTGLLAAAGFLGLLTRWAFAVACVACLLVLLAVALRYGQGRSLRGYLDTRGGEQEPGRWPAFERGFRSYASTPRDQNPLRRAVTRPRSRTAGADGGRVARRSPDVIAGGRP